MLQTCWVLSGLTPISMTCCTHDNTDKFVKWPVHHPIMAFAVYQDILLPLTK